MLADWALFTTQKILAQTEVAETMPADGRDRREKVILTYAADIRVLLQTIFRGEQWFNCGLIGFRLGLGHVEQEGLLFQIIEELSEHPVIYYNIQIMHSRMLPLNK